MEELLYNIINISKYRKSLATTKYKDTSHKVKPFVAEVSYIDR